MTSTAVRQPPRTQPGTQPGTQPVRRPRSLTHPRAPRPVTPLGLVRPLSPACPDSPALFTNGGLESLDLTPAPARVRLTRRGRLSLTLATLSIIALAVVGFGAAPASPPQVGVPSSPVHASPARSGETALTVRPGDTLWSIARRVAPGVDPRVAVQRITERNGLRSSAVLAGQRLILPPS
jgi:LysM domain-containing protein